MCGIAGVVDRLGEGLDEVDRLVATLRHRGPDSIGVYRRPLAALGQARLAVIDLVTGDPPITNEDGSVGVAFNGEIYNYPVLQHDLRRAGHQLKTEGDTEVIAHLAEDLDPVALPRRLDGMFAFAVWDDKRRRLVLGRDRFGKKPLYYWHSHRRLAFGSELPAVLADHDVPRRLDPDALPGYLTFGYVATPRTFFDGVRSVPPGHVLTFWPDTGQVAIEPYWHPPLPGVNGCPPLHLDLDEAATEVRRLLCDAVERRLVADVPVGAFLSGGIDSSSVVALMARLSPQPVRSFTIGFDDREGYDERPFAAIVARRFGTDHTEFVVQPDKAALIEQLVDHYGQPFGDSSALPTWLLSELTRGHVTVALCGDGGDELFAGYERFAAGVALCRLAHGGALAARIPAIALAPLGGRAASVRRMLDRVPRGMPQAYLDWISYVPEVWRDRLLKAGAGSGAHSTADWASDDWRRAWGSTAGARPLDRLLNLNLRTYLLDDLLPKVDRMAMAHGLEVRSPFLDTELSEFALRLPPRTKVAGLSSKRVLKAAVRDLLPPAILNRRKRGFGVPLDRWFRTDLGPYLRAMLCSAGTRCRGYVDGEAVHAMVEAHQGGSSDLGHALWALLTLEVFLRRQGW